MNKQELLKQDLVYNNGLNINKIKNITNSLLVAEKFNKKHFHILRDIENILKTNGTKIGAVKMYIQKKEYIDSKGEKRPYYEMDKDFFILLVMGYNGKEAINFKIDYINKFNQMEQELLQRRDTRQIGKSIRFNFTDFIKFTNGSEKTDFTQWSYKLFSDLVYKLTFKGETAKQRRLKLKLKPNQNLRDFLTNEENLEVQKWETYIRDLCISKDWHKLKSKECFNKVRDFLKI